MKAQSITITGVTPKKNKGKIAICSGCHSTIDKNIQFSFAADHNLCNTCFFNLIDDDQKIPMEILMKSIKHLSLIEMSSSHKWVHRDYVLNTLKMMHNYFQLKEFYHHHQEISRVS